MECYLEIDLCRVEEFLKLIDFKSYVDYANIIYNFDL